MNDGGHGYSFTVGRVTYRIHTVCGSGLTKIVVETMPAQESK